MKVAGIIVEYNPFHKGHIYHLEKVKELVKPDVIVAVMSGNFVQRGEMAIIDKWQRAKTAIEYGVDIVLELPFVFATQSATQFGENAVKILNLANVDTIVFGSETNNIEELKEIASMSFNINNFKENMKKGYSYPKSYGFMCDSFGPNDVLAISYLKALQKYPNITPISILRTSDYNNDEIDYQFPSALSLRKAVYNKQNIDNLSPLSDKLKDYPSPQLKDYYGYIRNILLNTKKEELAKIFLMDEGIESLLIKNAYNYSSYDDFINNCISRRYTRSRIQRTLCQLLVNNKKEDINNLPDYNTIRVLAFSDKGKEYLKYLQANGVKIANHFTANQKQYRDIEFKSAVAYSMNMNEKMKEYITRSEISGLNNKQGT